MPIKPGIPLTCPNCKVDFVPWTLAMKFGEAKIVQSGNRESCPNCRYMVTIPSTTGIKTILGPQHIPQGYVPHYVENSELDEKHKIIFRLGDGDSGNSSFTMVTENEETYLFCRDSPDWKLSFHKTGMTHFGFLDHEKARHYGFGDVQRHFSRGVRYNSFLGDIIKIAVIDYYSNDIKIIGKNLKQRDITYLKEYKENLNKCRFTIYFSNYNPMLLNSTKEILSGRIMGLIKVCDREFFAICADMIGLGYELDRTFDFSDEKFEIQFGTEKGNIFYVRIGHKAK